MAKKKNKKPNVVKMADDADAQARKDALYREAGSTGLTRFGIGGVAGESVVTEHLAELRGASGRAIYREMRLNSPVVAAVLSAIGWAMRAITYKAKPASEDAEDERAAEFLDECLDDLSFSFSDEMSFIIDPMLEQGFSLLETVYKKRLGRSPEPYDGVDDPAISKHNDGLIAWRKWVPRPANSLAEGQEWQFDDTGGIQGVWQAGTAPTWDPVFIPIERLLNFRTTAAPANSPEGLSLLRSMYIPYYFATQIAEIEGIGVERDLAGLPVAYTGHGASLDPNDTTSDYSLLKNTVTNIRRDSAEGVVMPGPKMTETSDGSGYLLELLSTGGSRQFDTSAIIHRYHTLMSLAALAQFVFLGLEKVGSYALANVHSEYFNLALKGWADNIADVLNRHAVPRLFALNPSFHITELPQLEHSEAGVPNLEHLAELINTLVGAKVLTPDESLEDHIRSTARLPERMEEEEIEVEPEEEPEIDEELLSDAEQFQDITLPSKRTRPGGPLFERRTNEYQIALEQEYIDWYGKTAKQLAAEDDDGVREELLLAALLLLRARLVRLGRQKLPSAVTLGAGSTPLSPEAWAALQTEVENNEYFIATSLIPAIEQKTRTALEDDTIRDEASIGGVFQAFLGRVSLYAGAYYHLVWKGWGEKIHEEERKATEKGEPPPRVRWVLDPDAKHCPDCIANAGSYESLDDMLMSTGGVMPGQGTQCDGRCRCRLEFESAGGWRR